MNVYVHEEITSLPESINLKEALIQLQVPHCAVLINSEFIPHSLHMAIHLKEGDKIELITPMQGG